MRVLYLPIKKRWFDMIKSGEKKEEYRELKKYWITRLSGKHYDVVEFRNGYGKNAPSFRVDCLGIEVGKGRKRWGAAPNSNYFVIKLGDIHDTGL